MSHSRLVSVELIDFMGYEYGRFDFDETGIISLKGYNSSGKTTVLRALGIINFNMYQQKQAKLIRHGQNRFIIKESFSDGVVITREKYLNGKSAYHLHKDGELFFSTVIDGVYVQVNEVPEYIAKYLDLIDDAKLNLHFRRGRDKLLLIDTTGRENYEFLSNALKAEELTQASLRLKTDRMKVKQEVTALEHRIESHRELVTKDKLITPRLVDALETVDESLDVNIDKKAQLEDMGKVFEVLSELKPSIELKPIDTSKVTDLLAISKAIEDYNSVRVTVSLTKVNYDKVIELVQLVEAMETYNKIQLLPKLPTIDTSKVTDLEVLRRALKELKQIETVMTEEEAKKQEKMNMLEQVRNWLNEQNVQVYQCKDCGSVQPVSEQHKHHI
ncbi:hypothetical protein [Bacillus toyonensis]|uniref:hypothetical protein n=1 Tax=Bacillus toyonensis TaxID=155322 RepID=UPI000BF9F67D|nr:hypothetical protein [Bacillus toyonensis]PGF05322.1 hypothetical protein COM61_02610 [Bacillus toyonensis]